jgi:hypothetical protein
MPQRRKVLDEEVSYSVYLTSYATQEIKDRVTSGQDYLSSADQLVTTALYLGSSERQAAWQFYRAAQEAMRNPLVISVKIRRDGKEYIRLTP